MGFFNQVDEQVKSAGQFVGNIIKICFLSTNRLLGLGIYSFRLLSLSRYLDQETATAK